MNRLGLSALLLAGCTSVGVGSVSQPIVGGTNDTADPGVVLIIAQQTGSQSASLCTGEVVSPHVVMTAAHCVSPQTLGTGTFKFTIFLGDDINSSTQSVASNFVAAKETHYDMQFDANNLGNAHDVGVVIASTPLKPAPLAMNTTAMGTNNVGGTLRIVGYGISSGTDTTGMTAGIKRQTMVTINDVTPDFIDFGNSAHDTCEGDSGGPAFLTVGGQEVIAGITSFGIMGCAQGATDTRVDVYGVPFVTPYIQMFDNGMTGAPDMSSPPDMSTTSSGGSPAPGTVGASCSKDTDCNSKVCANKGDNGYCTTSCDPSKSDSCPSGLTCGTIDSANYCVMQSGGCDFAGGGVPGGALVLLLFAGLALAARRRRS
jgi:secreted trypsin-like serine protease